jgi:hypothetical protein
MLFEMGGQGQKAFVTRNVVIGPVGGATSRCLWPSGHALKWSLSALAAAPRAGRP